VLLWVNCFHRIEPPELVYQIGDECTVRWLRDPSGVPAAVAAVRPQILSFDFDNPNAFGLERLRATKMDFPAIPILMLTEDHSEALAVWALRARVWDYLVKPVPDTTIQARVQALCAGIDPPGRRSPRRPIQIAAPEWVSAPAEGAPRPHYRAILRAKAYVEEHLGDDLDVMALARYCSMSYFHFSRTFKRVYGKTFTEFLHELRVQRAAELLRIPAMSVTRACYDAGFHSLPHFGRIFRRYMSVSPSEYQKSIEEAPLRSRSAGIPGA
jgi:AraC-like DNA-binding protein/CheY-like chemotaxis protein